jgi:hypothetical protein
MHKNAMMCKKTQRKWCINKHGASKIIDTFETYQCAHYQLHIMGEGVSGDYTNETTWVA